MLMRAPTRWARPKLVRPPGFIVPCQPTLANTVPAGDGWIHELKHVRTTSGCTCGRGTARALRRLRGDRNKLIERPWTIMSIGLRDWANGF
jgi:hypothetical protein